ncbi:MAG: hypothetical protein ACQEU4_20700 [Bacillota bacterium]
MNKGEFGRSSIIFFVFSFLTLILLFSFNYGGEKLLLLLLPLIYGGMFLSIAKIHRYITNPGMFTLNVISAIRYLLMPILIILDPNYIDEYGTLSQGITFMIFEALCLGTFLIFITRKYYRNVKNQSYIELGYKKNILLKITVIFAIILVIKDPSILLQYTFAFEDSSSITLIKSRELVTGINGMIIDWGKLVLPLLISLILIKKYRNSNNNIYYYLTLLTILFLNVMIFSGTSRSSAIMPAVASMFFLINVFPNKRKRIFLLMGSTITIVAIQLTLLKTSYYGTGIQASIGSVINYLEAYFVGPKNLGIAVLAKESYSNVFTINTLLNDLMGNFPGLSHFFNLENRTNTFYNIVFYNGGSQRDQIIPSMGQGLFYFGYVFSFIPQMLIVYGMAKFDSFFKKANNLAAVYFFSYFAVRFGYTYVQSVSSILSFLYSIIIPITLIYILNNFLNKSLGYRRSVAFEKNKTTICNKQY